MPIKTNLNTAPYHDDFNETKKYYRILFVPGNAVQARELTQMQTILQNQIERFGNNIFKEGSIVEGCSFTELRNLKYIKVIDGINPTLYVERVEIDTDNRPVEYWYELEGVTSGLKAYIVNASRGFYSNDPDLNTFYINYLNTTSIGGVEQKEFLVNESILIREYKLIQQEIAGEIVETTIDNGIIASTNVASVDKYSGASLGLAVSSGVVYQRGHFLLVDEQNIIIKKFYDENETDAEGNFLPHNIAVGFYVSEDIVTSQQDTSLLDNANGSENENAPGADRLMLTPVLTSLPVAEANLDPNFFALRRYMNGSAVTTRDVSVYNVLGNEMATRTYEESGDYSLKPISLEASRRVNGDLVAKLGPSTIYSQGFRVESAADRFFKLDEISSTQSVNHTLSFEYGGYFEITNSAAGPLTLASFQTVELLNSSAVAIGSAIVKNVVNGRVYLFAIRMASNTTPISAIASLKQGSNAAVQVKPVLMDSDKSRLVFRLPETGVKSVSNLSIPVRRIRTDLTTTANQVTIPALTDETFDGNSAQNFVVYVNGSVTSVSNVTVTPTALTFTVSAASGATSIYYTSTLKPVTPRVKQSGTYFVKIIAEAGKKAYSLGLADAYKVVKISSATQDYTSSFVLRSNQNDNFYDHSYVELFAGKPTPPVGEVLTVEFKAFVPDTSGSTVHYFTADSYVNVQPEEIPVFSGNTGIYNLAGSLDFRPYRTATVAYATTAAAAPTVTSLVGLPAATVQIFPVSSMYVVPADNAFGSASIESYTSRIDSLVLDSYGEFFILKGAESKFPIAPELGKNTLLASIKIPTRPALTEKEARDSGQMANAVSVKVELAQRHTMKDIGNIKKTVEDLRYYVMLNALEKNAQDMLIVDEDGLDRFKTGILVDSFNSFKVADLSDPLYNAAINPDDGILYSAFEQYQLELEPVESSGVTIHNNKVVALEASGDVEFIKQSAATSYRNCTSNFYNFTGQGALSPSYDASYDTVTSPAVSLDLDISSYFSDLMTNLQNFIPLNTSQTVQTGNNTTWGVTSDRQNTTTTLTNTQTFRETQTSLNMSSSTSSTGSVSYLKDFQFEPYMKSRPVRVYMAGLRPNTRHYFYFDTVDVNAFVAPAKLGPNGSVESIAPTAVSGQPVVTDANGVLCAVFMIPPEQFYVGDRVLEIADVDDYSDRASASLSRGSLTYRAYSFTATTGSFGLNIREPDFSTSQTTTNRTVVNRSVFVQSNERGNAEDQSGDPLAQTFYVKKGLSDSKEVYVGRLDLFFKRRSATNGITVMIREVENGYPSSKILPFGSVHLNRDQVQVSDNASAVTTIHFPVPLRLEAEKEYCFVVMPDANDPDYLIYTSRVGQADIKTGIPVNQDWGEGVLFTSTNNRAWQSYQDEDACFILYRKNFSSKTGSVKLAPAGYEFLKINAVTGSFKDGEQVYCMSSQTTTLNATAGSFQLSGVVSTFSVGDILFITNGVVKQLMKVTVVDLVNGNITVDKAPLYTAATTVTKVVAGDVSLFDNRKPTDLTLSHSSATSSFKFEVGNNIIGLESGATATIASIENLDFSYAVPMINRQSAGLNVTSGVFNVISPDTPLDVPSELPLSFTNITQFKTTGCMIYSRSNDFDRSSETGLTITLNCGYQDTFSTPMVDIESASLFGFINEEQNSYISKIVTLADDFDASDFRVYTTTYRPSTTDVDVYIRVQNAADPNNIRSNDWIKLEKTSKNNIYSSDINEEDYKEITYQVPDANKTSVGGEMVTLYTNNYATFNSFKRFQIRIDLKGVNRRVMPKMKDYMGIALR